MEATKLSSSYYVITATSEADVLHGVLEERVVALELGHFEHLRVYVQLHVHAAPLRDARVA